MEIEVTRLLGDINPHDVSGSIATHGPNAAKVTWNAAKQAAETPLTDDLDGIREWASGFGAWSEEELEAMDSVELNALVLQYASQDLSELQSLCPGDGLGDVDWIAAEKYSNDGIVGGHLFFHDGRLFIHLE